MRLLFFFCIYVISFEEFVWEKWIIVRDYLSSFLYVVIRGVKLKIKRKKRLFFVYIGFNIKEKYGKYMVFYKVLSLFVLYVYIIIFFISKLVV